MVNPLKTRQDNKVESFNQLLLAFSCFHVLLFTDFVLDTSMQYDLGWCLISFFCIIVGVNFYFIGGMIFNIVKLLCVYYYRLGGRYWKKWRKEDTKNVNKVMTQEEIEEADRRREIGLRILQQRAKREENIFENGNDPNPNSVNLMNLKQQSIHDDELTFEEPEEVRRERRVSFRLEKMRRALAGEMDAKQIADKARRKSSLKPLMSVID